MALDDVDRGAGHIELGRIGDEVRLEPLRMDDQRLVFQEPLKLREHQRMECEQADGRPPGRTRSFYH